MKVPLKVAEKGMGEPRHGGEVFLMETLELGVVNILRKLRQMEEDEGVSGGVTHIKGHKVPGKLEEVSNGGDHTIQVALPLLNETFPLYH